MSARKFTSKLFFGWLSGLFLAVLAFSQASASVGLAINSFRPLGAGFFSWRSGQMRLSIKIFESASKASAKQAVNTGRAILTLAPLTPRSLWLVGRGLEIQGDLPAARRAMLQAHRVSRRDGAVELWLGVDNLRRTKATAGLRHFDLMMRGDRQAGTAVMPQLALVLASPEGRRALAPYIEDDNPWLLDLLHAAATNLPRAAPLAITLIDRKKEAPDIRYVRPVYAALLKRLVRERDYQLALKLYPLLPGSDERALREVDPTGDETSDGGYPPFVWDFPDGSVQGGNVVAVDRGRTGLDIFGSPGTVGVAASKLVAPNGATHLLWRIDDRVANVQGSARWEAVCLIGARKRMTTRSIDLLDSKVPLNRIMKMPLPEKCELLQLDMRIAGGIGRSPATILVSNLELSSAGAKR